MKLAPEDDGAPSSPGSAFCQVHLEHVRLSVVMFEGRIVFRSSILTRSVIRRARGLPMAISYFLGRGEHTKDGAVGMLGSTSHWISCSFQWIQRTQIPQGFRTDPHTPQPIRVPPGTSDTLHWQGISCKITD